jgi:hypothetical protein
MTYKGKPCTILARQKSIHGSGVDVLIRVGEVITVVRASDLKRSERGQP